MKVNSKERRCSWWFGSFLALAVTLPASRVQAGEVVTQVPAMLEEVVVTANRVG